MELFLLCVAFFAGFLLIFGVNWLLVDIGEERRRRARSRLQEELKLRQKEKARSTAAYKDLYLMAAEGLAEVKVKKSLWDRFSGFIEESGMTVRPEKVALLCSFGALLAGGVAWWFTRSIMLSLLVGVAGVAVPFGIVMLARARRTEKLLSQLPDAFDLMSRALKAGQTMSQSLLVVSDECPSPVSDEFLFCYEQQNLGLTAEAALRDLGRRNKLLEIKIFVLAVMVQRQTGGNLATLLTKLSRVIRERYRIRRSIKALTAEGRMQAYVLLSLPPFMLLALLLINRPYVMPLFDYPILLIGMFISMLIGAFWMHRIISFDF